MRKSIDLSNLFHVNKPRLEERIAAARFAVSAAAVLAFFAMSAAPGAAVREKAACPESAGRACADIGNLDDERDHDLDGWGEHRDPAVETASNGDRSKRYQTLRGDNALMLFIAQPNTPSDLIAETEDGGCDDSFEIRVGDSTVYIYKHDPEKNAIVLHHVPIPAKLLPDKSVKIVFRNLARDECGLAAVFYVRLIPRPT